MSNVIVAEVGMIPFSKPRADDFRAGKLALEDAGVDCADVAQAYVGCVYGDPTAGQLATYGLGITGIPIISVNINWSTGSTALFLAREMEGARLALQHNLGLGGACVATSYERV